MHSEAHVTTNRASHYIKTLSRHFSHKVQSEYTETRGTVQFPFGFCEMLAEPETLIFKAQADDAEALQRVKDVVGGHLIEFTYRGDTLEVNWVDQSQSDGE